MTASPLAPVPSVPSATPPPPAPPGPTPLLTTRAAAVYLGLPLSTFEKLSRAGALPRVRFGDAARAHVRYCREDLDAYVAARRTPATTGPLAGSRRPRPARTCATAPEADS